MSYCPIIKKECPESHDECEFWEEKEEHERCKDGGCGVVFAKTKEDAIKMINDHPYSTVIELEVEELDISKPLIVDHSWSK